MWYPNPLVIRFESLDLAHLKNPLIPLVFHIVRTVSMKLISTPLCIIFVTTRDKGNNKNSAPAALR